jgi:hypothetical protein
MNVVSRLEELFEDAPCTLADARRIVSRWDDLPLSRRRGLQSSLSAIAKICGADTGQEAALPLTCEHLNARLFAKPPAVHGVTTQRFGKIISHTRSTLRRLGLHAPETRGPRALSPAWLELRTRLPPL